MSLIRALRPKKALMLRRIVSAIEDDLEKPSQYYVVKDYDLNDTYNIMIYVSRPGAKKQYDPFLKAFDRKDAFWKPKYYGHQIDNAGPPSLIAFTILLPIAAIILYYKEMQSRTYRKNPLAFNNAVASEL